MCGAATPHCERNESENAEPKQIPEERIFHVHTYAVKAKNPVRKDTVHDVPQSETDRQVAQEMRISMLCPTSPKKP